MEEANQLLAQVRPLVEQLQGLHRSVLATNQRLDECVEKLSAGNGYPIQQLNEQVNSLTAQQLQLIESIQSTLQQLEALGCTLKDVDVGLVDFYGLREGDIVCLCWRLGEERIQFWHGVEEGFAGRQPI